MTPEDTIVAISSASGGGARMIVRTSGGQSIAVARNLTGITTGIVNFAARATLSFDSLKCPAWIYVFHSPRSYTGEDLVEYHLPGNAVLAGMFVRFLQFQGLRPAEAGEFTARAFFNGRIDLTRAEGVAATISAQSEQELDAARQLMAGELARRLTPILDELALTLALVEVGIDFSDEDVTFLDAAALSASIDTARSDLLQLLSSSSRWNPLAQEPTFALVGRPNAGKSTLLNALAGSERAISSPVAGTTRDALSAIIALPRGWVRIIDLAGISDVEASEAGEVNEANEVKHSMRRVADRAAREADFALHIQAVDDPLRFAWEPVHLTVRTKADLPVVREHFEAIYVSALTGVGLEKLRAALDQLAFGGGGTGAAKLALNTRHVTAIERAITDLSEAERMTANGPEFVAAELRQAISAIGNVLGQVTPDDLLDKIFSQFCIGK